MGKVWIRVVIFAFISAGLGGCSKPAAPPAGPKTGPGGATITNTAMVSVASVGRRDISRTTEVTGSLVALRDVVVGAKQSGKLSTVYFHEGDSVSAGQTVAVMDAIDLSSQVQQAQANLHASVTKEDQARIQVTQARNQLQNAKTTLSWTDETTTEGVQTAKAGLETARQRLVVVKQGARQQERHQAEDNVAGAKANYDKAKSDRDRYRALYKEEAVSQSQLDEKQAVYESAQASYSSAQQALSLIREGARPEDIRTAELAVNQSQQALNRAQSDRANVKMRAEDVQNAKTAIASAQAGIENARAGVTQMRAALRITQDALNNAYVKSPISGFVAERRAEPGQQLGSGGAIMRIIDPRSVYFQAVVSESQYSSIRIGMTASVTIDALPGRVFHGSVTRILPVASSAARSFIVRIDIPVDPRLRPQMFARGNILIETHRAALVVPKDAVVFDTETHSAHVFVSKQGAAVERKVSTGFSDPKQIEILSGVEQNDKVIVAGQTTLQNGDKIRIQ